MINNEKQYLITLEKIRDLKESQKNTTNDSIFSSTHIIQTEALIKELEKEVEEYLAKLK